MSKKCCDNRYNQPKFVAVPCFYGLDSLRDMHNLLEMMSLCKFYSLLKNTYKYIYIYICVCSLLVNIASSFK